MPDNVERVGMGVHLGHILQYLAQNYGSGFAVIGEAVQNAIDEGARKIYVVVDCVKSSIQIFDDGRGAPKDKIVEKFQNIGVSLKAGVPGAIGAKGIGNLAGMSVADRWELITRDTSRKDPLRSYSFERRELSKAANVGLVIEELPFRDVPGAPFRVPTVLRLTGVDETTLRQLKDQAVIERTLREAFNVKLRVNKIELRVLYRDSKNRTAEFLVKPIKFRGTPLEADEAETKFGTVTFEMYHSSHPVQNPSILVLHQGTYSIPLSNLFMLKILPQDIQRIFEKGFFEGEIRLGFCELNSSRTGFAHNPELAEFVRVMEEFGRDVLGPLVSQIEQSGREEKLRAIAEAVLKRLKKFLDGHRDLLPPSLHASALRVAQKDQPAPNGESVSVRKKTPRPAPLSPDALKKQRRETKERKVGPKTAKTITSVGTGLTITYVDPHPDEGYAWHSRMLNGVIQINATNLDCMEAERRGRTVLAQYVFLLAQKELTVASLPPPQAQLFGEVFERTFLAFAKASLFE